MIILWALLTIILSPAILLFGFFVMFWILHVLLMACFSVEEYIRSKRRAK